MKGDADSTSQNNPDTHEAEAAPRGGQAAPVNALLPQHIWGISCPEHDLPQLSCAGWYLFPAFYYLNLFLLLSAEYVSHNGEVGMLEIQRGF